MYLSFYLFSFFTVLFTVLTIIQKNLMYALFYFFLSVLTTSFMFFLLGNYFIGSLQIIIYTGAILVLFVFIVMLIDTDLVKNQFYHISYYYYLYFLFFIFFFMFLFLKIFYFLHVKYVFNVIYNLNILGRFLFEPYILIIEFISILLLSIVVIVVVIGKNKNDF